MAGSSPTTKDQVQAYKFVLRRMQSALVRKDAVMLHEPMRAHGRSMIIGSLIGAVIVVGFLVVGAFNSGGANLAAGIVISKQSGQMYVYSKSSNLLTPTFNLASARLLMAAKSSSGSSNGAAPDATVVDQSALSSIPVGRMTGIPDGPDLIPTQDQRATGLWGVCDYNNRNGNAAAGQTSQTDITTVLYAAAPTMGTDLSQDNSVLVRLENSNQYYLIYRTKSDVNSTSGSDDAVIAPVDLSNKAVVYTFGLNNDEVIRPITPALLNAIPAAPQLKVPASLPITSSKTLGSDGLPATGAVGQVNNAGVTKYYVSLGSSEIEEVPQSFAALVNTQNSGMQNVASATQSITSISPTAVANAKTVTYGVDKDAIDVSKFPENQPIPIKGDVKPSLCLSWASDASDTLNPKVHTKITLDTELPNSEHTGDHTFAGVKIGTPGDNGFKVDYFWMPTGKAAVVRGVSNGKDSYVGPISLVTQRGVRYGVPDIKTAKAVGFDLTSSSNNSTGISPAPTFLVGLLPSANELNFQAAQKTFDTLSVPSNVGSYPSVTTSTIAGS